MGEPRDARQAPASPEPDPQTLLAAVALLAIGAVLAARLAARHPAFLALCAGAALVLSVVAVLVRARWKDARAAGADPAGPGLIIGTIRGSWLLSRRRPFYVPWASLLQHVLICGPTGRGKTFTFVTPVLKANAARPDTGVFYLDGKGDRIDQPDGDQPGVVFDHVFCPADPAGSACWNPLAGSDPVQAARDFAAALYPEAAQASANFYETRAVFAITRVAPALALTGYAAGEGSMWNVDADQVVAALGGAGVDEAVAGDLVRRFGAQRCMQQLAWLAHRRPGADLAELIRRNASPAADTPLGLLADSAGTVTPALLSRVLFQHGELEALSNALRRAHAAATNRTLRSTLEQLRADVDVLAALPQKERAAMLANLQNRLGYFLQPPFLQLCGRSDFQVADVCDGARVAFLLPTGAFPDVAQPLGRIALAQFRNAVLSGLGPGRRKIAVLDEFHNFVDPTFGAFLAQARSFGGGAVLALQSLAQLGHGPGGRQTLDELLANLSTIIVTPGCRPFDAQYFADLFGEEERPHLSYTYEQTGPFEVAARPSVRVEHRDAPRYTATQIAELRPNEALIQVTDRRVSYPATIVDVERG